MKTVPHEVGDLVTRDSPCSGYASDFMIDGCNYRVTSIKSDGAGGQHIQVRGSDGWFSGGLFRKATLDDAYNPAPAGDEALGKKRALPKRDTSWRSQVGSTLPLVDEPNPLTQQEGGDHYKKLPVGYQPYEIAHALGLNGMEMNALKYVIRHRDKNKAADLRKAIHTLQILLRLEYGEN